MIKRSFTDNSGVNWSRIDKRLARTLFNKGIDICISPCNMRPFGVWGCGVIVNINGLIEKYSYTDKDIFTLFCNEFEFYNCSSYETGYHPAFYTREV